MIYLYFFLQKLLKNILLKIERSLIYLITKWLIGSFMHKKSYFMK